MQQAQVLLKLQELAEVIDIALHQLKQPAPYAVLMMSYVNFTKYETGPQIS